MSAQFYRERLDTACTVDSKDSGIDLDTKRKIRTMPVLAQRQTPSLSKSPPKKISKQQNNHVPETPHAGTRLVDSVWNYLEIETVLWTMAFIMTVYFFRLPISIWFSYRTYWPSIYASMLFAVLLWCSGLIVFIRERKKKIPNSNLFMTPIVWICLLCSCATFCHGVWPLYHLWSVYIVFVSSMFLISATPLMTYLVLNVF